MSPNVKKTLMKEDATRKKGNNKKDAAAKKSIGKKVAKMSAKGMV